jgi:phosphoribosyl 1,2-cyclic phosphodiesterase
MKLQVIGTGSKGNCYALHAGGEILLLDSGLPYNEITKTLNYDISKVIGCLVTHEHQDHCKAVSAILKAGLNCYMSNSTKETLYIQNWDCITVKPKQSFKLGSFSIMPFDVQHDASEPLGFLIKYLPTGEQLIYATDTYFLKYTFPGTHYWLIECNYIDDLIQDTAFKNRLIESHMSLNRLVDVFKANDLSTARQIVLVHLSDERSDEKLMTETIKNATNVPCIAARNGMVIDLELQPF